MAMDIIGHCYSCKALVNTMYKVGGQLICGHCYELVLEATGAYDEER